MPKASKSVKKKNHFDTRLKKVYYDPKHPASFGGLSAIEKAVNEDQSKKKIPIKYIQKWLSEQSTYTLHKPPRVHFRRNRVIVGGIDEQWQADLVDLSSISQYNNEYHFLLTCIDVFSKFAWAVPLTRKTGSNLIQAFDSILQTGRKPERLQTDAGTEFLNRPFQDFLKKNDIEFFVTRSEMKASVVERFNRTLKTKMWKYFTWKNTLRYVEILPDLMYSYNHSYHRSIKMKPALVNKSNEKDVWETLYGSLSKTTSKAKFKLQIGDQVRISKQRRTFKKGYLPSWTEEIFVISNRIARTPPVYQVKDLLGESIEGIFYGEELQKVNKTDDVFRVEDVVKQRTRKGKKEYLIKWMGYPEKFNSWVPEEDLKRI